MSDNLPTDEELDAAAPQAAPVEEPEEVIEEEETEVSSEEGVQEEADAEEVEPEVVPEEPDDHGERSQLGRRVGDIERNVNARMDEVLGRLDSFTQGFQRAQTPPATAPTYDFDPDEEVPMTRGELERLLSHRETKKAEVAQAQDAQYQAGYREKFASMAQGYEGEEAKVIEAEMMANFNVRHSTDPHADAERNFTNAENAVLRNRITALEDGAAQPKVKLKGGQPKGGPTSQTPAPRKAGNVTLDKDAAHLLESMDLSTEEVEKVLSGDMPLNLVQGNVNA